MAKTDLEKHPHDPFLGLLDWLQFLDDRIESLEAEYVMTEGSSVVSHRQSNKNEGLSWNEGTKEVHYLLRAIGDAKSAKAQCEKDLMPYFYERLAASRVKADVDTTVRSSTGPVSATADFIADVLGGEENSSPSKPGKG